MISELVVKQPLPRVSSLSGNVEGPVELGGESDCILSKVLAVMKVHGFDKDAAVSVTSTTCPRLTTVHIPRDDR